MIKTVNTEAPRAGKIRSSALQYVTGSVSPYPTVVSVSSKYHTAVQERMDLTAGCLFFETEKE